MNLLILLVGCGGIGGNIARDLPKILNPNTFSPNHKIILIDGDTIETSNTTRQPYQSQDVNQNKAQVLARKLNSFYHYDVEYFDQYITAHELDLYIKKYALFSPVIIGALDNDNSRNILEETFKRHPDIVYIDGANSEYEGNIYVAARTEGVQHGKLRSDIYELSSDDHPTDSCETQINQGNTQYLITNNKIAAFILEHIHHLLLYNLKVGVTKIDKLKTLHY